MKITITPKQALAYEFADKKNLRPALHHVMVNEDTAVATDSFTLLEVKRTSPLEDIAEFPDTIKPIDVSAPMLISADTAKAIADFKSHPNLPITQQACITAETDDDFIVSMTDLDNVKNLKSRKIEEPYPDYQKVMPMAVPKTTVNVNVDYLLKIAKTLKKFNKGNIINNVTIEVREGLTAVVFRCKNDNHEATALLMPFRTY